ncbi:MAG: Sensor histidine kinase TmoS [Syntrophus sp. PtaU1.Bin208]|nr:MAG: Sensor histidine kinase TmoS [Syntrophus sp. PtaU1.Bin208]
MDRRDQKYQALIEENADLKRKIRKFENVRVERQKMDDVLLENEATYRMIAENTADIIRILDMDMRSTYISPSVLRIRGLTVEEASKQTLADIFPPESLKTLRYVFKEELKLEATGTADPDRFRTVEAEVYKKDGSRIWMEIVFSLLRNRNGKLIGILSVSRDITRAKKNEALLSSLFQAAPLAVYVADGDRLLIKVNDYACEIFGYPTEEMLG